MAFIMLWVIVVMGSLWRLIKVIKSLSKCYIHSSNILCLNKHHCKAEAIIMAVLGICPLLALGTKLRIGGMTGNVNKPLGKPSVHDIRSRPWANFIGYADASAICSVINRFLYPSSALTNSASSRQITLQKCSNWLFNGSVTSTANLSTAMA